MEVFSGTPVNCSVDTLLWIKVDQNPTITVINNEKKPIILKKLKMPEIGQI